MKHTIALAAALAILAAPAMAGGRDHSDRVPSNNNRANAEASAKASAAAIAAQQQGQIQAQGQRQDASSRNTNSNSYVNRTAASSAIAPSMGGGNCNVGVGLGLSEVWGSMSTGVSWRNVPCAVQGEAADFARMGMRDAAILHLAMWHKRMGKTLEAAGLVRRK